MKSLFISSFEKNKKYHLKTAHIVKFIGLFLVLLALLELANRVFFVSRSKNYSILAAFEKEKARCRIVFLGDSHCAFGIDAGRFDEGTFNLSFGGASYIQSYYLLKHYIEQMPSLKIVVVPLGLHSFSSYKIGRVHPTIFWRKFIDYAELEKFGRRRPFAERYHVLTLLDRRLGRKFFVKNVAASVSGLLWRKAGSIGFERGKMSAKTEGSDREHALNRADYHLRGRQVFDEILLVYFGKIEELCRQKGVLLATVQIPVSKDYAKRAGDYITGQELRQKVLQTCAYSDAIYTNFDFLSLYFDRDDFFYGEGDHLNEKGREAFSVFLASRIAGLAVEIE